MKTRLFIMSMLLMPLLLGCSKTLRQEQWIIGDWYLSGLESNYESAVYLVMETWCFISFYKDGTCIISAIDGPELHHQKIMYGTWTTNNRKLTFNAYGYDFEIMFETPDRFYYLDEGKCNNYFNRL